MTDKEDKINKPNHYVQGRKFEPIHVIRDWDLNFALGNAVKYISRAGRKVEDEFPGSEISAAIQDLKKAAFYVQDEINALEVALAKVDLPKKSYEEIAVSKMSEQIKEEIDKQIVEEFSNASKMKPAWGYQIFSGSSEGKSPNPDTYDPDTFVHPLEKAQDAVAWNGVVTMEQLDSAVKEAIKAESLNFKTKTLEEGLAKCSEISKNPVININGRFRSWPKTSIFLHEIISEAVRANPDTDRSRYMTATVKYKNNKNNLNCTLSKEGHWAEVEDGMVINCFRTDNA